MVVGYIASLIEMVFFICANLTELLLDRYIKYTLNPKNLTDEEGSVYFNREYARKKDPK